MCGIAGTYGLKSSKVALNYLRAIKHRGPDEGPNIVSKKGFSLGAVRLSIVDVKSGHQPMEDKSTGNVVAFNGEIYNYPELKLNLEKEGIKFDTDCDTEVLLRGFSKYGPKFVEELNGIFGIAFLNNAENTLFLFRDSFGVKPLHYINSKGTLRFSSEIKSFFTEDAGYKLDLDFIIFNKVFGCSLPEGSLYTNIKTVKPGSYLSFQKGQIKLITYSPKVAHPTPKNWVSAKKDIASELNDSVSSQIPKEVDWAVLLSGGVDSSILSWISQNNYTKKINTYSVCSTETETDDFVA